MAKLLVTIDVPNMTVEELEKDIKENPVGWFDEGYTTMVIDRAYLKTNHNDDDFYDFEFIRVVE